MKKIISIILSLIILFCMYAPTSANTDIDEIINDTAEYIYKTVDNPTVSSIGGEWTILGLARCGKEIPSEYFDKYYENVKKTLRDTHGVLHKRKYTEYSRVIIALTSIGRDPSDVNGYNLLTAISDYDKTVLQNVNGPAFALIALDSGNYSDENNLRDRYAEYILNNQNKDGGWSISGNASDVDTTAMVLQALSDYRENENVKKAVEKALDFISLMQLENGGFESGEEETCESSSQVMVALCELGIDLNDKRFIKNGNTVFDNLITFYSEGNGFKHLIDDDKTNLMATEQALYALAALKRVSENKTTLYDMSDVYKKESATDTNTEFSAESEYVKILPVIHKGKTFDDISNSQEKTKIEALAERGMINGRTDTEFAPFETMTRAEFASIIVKSLGLDFVGENLFSDVYDNSWYKDYITTAYAHDIIKGVSSCEFNPDGTITKEEAAVMIKRAAKLCKIENTYDADAIRDILAGYEDYTQASDWSKEALAFCYDNNIISNDDIKILPKQAAKRELIASMLYNMLFCAKLI